MEAGVRRRATAARPCSANLSMGSGAGEEHASSKKAVRSPWICWAVLVALIVLPPFVAYGGYYYYDNCEECCWIWQLWWHRGLQDVEECERVATVSSVKRISSGGYRTVWQATMPKYAFNRTMWAEFRKGVYKLTAEDQTRVQVVYKPLTQPRACGKRMAHFREVLVERVLQHPNVVPFVASCGFDSYGPISTVNEFQSGGTLETALKAGAKLSVDGRVGIMLDIARALNYMHTHPSGIIVHDDLNWAQVLLNEERTQALLTDFNLAAHLYPGETKQRSWWPVGGTWKYFAPEKLRMAPYDSTVDIYSLGVIFYQLMQPRREEFSTMTRRFYVQNVLHNESGWRPRRPSAALDWEWSLIDRCLQFRSGNRPTIRQVVEELEGYS